MTNTLEDFIKNLKSIADDPKESLEKEVALEALTHDDEYITHFFEDLLHHGCISGIVSSLIYYSDTHAFFDKYYYDIMELKVAYEEEIGQSMAIPYHLKNHLAWFAFEETARGLFEKFQNERTLKNDPKQDVF